MIHRKIAICFNPGASVVNSEYSTEKNDAMLATYLTTAEIVGKMAAEVVRGYANNCVNGVGVELLLSGDCHCISEPSEGGATKLLRVTISDNGMSKGQTLVTTENIGRLTDVESDIRLFMVPPPA